jgi:hypothetical protein
LTITLGDEFQGIIRSADAGVEILLVLEELRLKHKPTIDLRYVLYEGNIDTPVNRIKAHGMLGEGLTNARRMLALMKRERSDRFHFQIKDQRMEQMLEDGFRVHQGIINDWKEADHQLVLSFLRFNDYKVVAAKLDKDVSLMWRRRKSLKIEEYLAMKRLISTMMRWSFETMTKYHLLAFLAWEVVAFFVFWFIRKRFKERRPTTKVVLMGIVERFMLLIGLALGYQTILVLFGAIKIGTRIKPSDPEADKVNADYFVIGNMVTVLIVLLDMLVVPVIARVFRNDTSRYFRPASSPSMRTWDLSAPLRSATTIPNPTLSLNFNKLEGKPLALPAEAAGPKPEYLELHRVNVSGKALLIDQNLIVGIQYLISYRGTTS